MSKLRCGLLKLASTALAPVCLALLGCLLLLCARSYRIGDDVAIARHSGERGPVRMHVVVGPASNYGIIRIEYLSLWTDDPGGMPDVPDGWSFRWTPYPAGSPVPPPKSDHGLHIDMLGFLLAWSSEAKPWPIHSSNLREELSMAIGETPRQYTTMHRVVASATLPDWFIAAVLALPPLARLRRFRRDRRRRARRRLGLCESCGYDLRGSSTGKCPECGAKAPGAEGSAGLEEARN